MVKNIVFLLLISFLAQAQLQKNVEVEVVGRPTWDMEIPLGEKGLLLMVKSDVTKIALFRFDSDLNTIWSKEYFLDAERAPKAYTIAEDHISLLFSETSGMYYQVFEIDLGTGELKQDGYEIREYFNDQDYVFLGNKVIMAGNDLEGAAFFTYDKQEYLGKLDKKDIKGQVQVNLFQYLEKENRIESLWSVKEKGYTDEKKKKGEYIKDAYLVYATFDTTGNLISSERINQKAGKFPTQGKVLTLENGQKFIAGTYQSSEGDKGVFTYNLTFKDYKTYPYAKLLSGGSSLSMQDIQLLYNQYNFLANDLVQGHGNEIIFGGTFFAPQYKTVTEQDPNWNNNGMYGRNRYDPYNRNWNRNNGRTQTRQVFLGFSYPTGFVAEFNAVGDLIKQNRIDLNHTASQVHQPLAFNQNGSVAYCVKGNVGANNFNISNKPILYKLSDEVGAERSSFIPKYESVGYWWDKYFFAIGTRSKIEATTVNDNLAEGVEIKKKKRRAKNTPPAQAEIRKTYYLTKIASGN